MVLIAFGYGRTSEFAKKYITFHIITYALGGSVYGFISLFGVSGMDFPVKTFIFAVVFTFLSIALASAVLERRKKMQRNIIPLIIHHNNEKTIIPCLQDTGNESGMIIVELEAVKKLLPQEFCIDIVQNENIIDIFEKWGNKLKLKVLPFNSIGNAGGILIGFLADSVKMLDRKSPRTIGIFCGKLSPSGMYGAIV